MKKIIITLTLFVFATSCTKSTLEDVTIVASEGNDMTVSGLLGGESSGAAAGNLVFIDFSKDQQTPLERAKWDLGFYCGTQNRVIINNSTAAMAVVIDKTNLDDVTAADVAGQTFEVDITDPNPTTFSKIDDLGGDLSKTVIPEITTLESKVVVIGRGTGGATPRRDLIKAQFLLTADGHYQVKWSKIGENVYETVIVAKDDNYNFKYVSFDNGLLEKAEPSKYNWDIVWGVSIYKTPNGSQMSAYIFSDMVGVNYLSGVTSIEKKYATVDEAMEAFKNYDLAQAETENFDNYRWNIGAKWRNTAAPGVTNAGVKKNQFYVIKDPQGSYYKLRFISFSEDDEGKRGEPEIRYELLK